MPLDEKIKGLIIPSGNEKDDIERAKAAIKYNTENSSNIPYIVSGLGPDTNIALGYEENEENKELDFHEKLYDFMINNTKGTFGIDIKSVNSIENILYTFPKGTEGKYILFSYPLHLKRFEKIINKAKEKGKISENLEIEFVPTRQTLKHFIYEKMGTIKRIKDMKRI